MENQAVGKTVLVVDDEEAVRWLIWRVLQAAGYDVLEARNGEEALSMLGQGGPVDLLVADVKMPGVEGDEMVRRARLIRPDIKVLYVTGFVDRLFEGRPFLWAHEAFLEKPFTMNGLNEAVSQLLWSRTAAPRAEPPAPPARSNGAQRLVWA